MNNEMFAKFNEMFGNLAQEIKEVGNAPTERKEVPFGNYEVRITKLELGTNQFEGEYYGMPEAHVWFKIIGDGEFGGQMLFMNRRLVSLTKPSANAFIIHNFNKFLESLETEVEVKFEDWEQYAEMIAYMFCEIDGKAEYQLAYLEDAKGYKSYEIVKRFQ